MQLDELYSKLNDADYIEDYYVSEKTFSGEGSDKTYRVLKLYGEENKIAEIYLENPYMMRTTYPGFDALNMLEKQLLLKILNEFANTPIEQRRAEVYFAYYYDLNGVTHFIKKLPNNRLADMVLPIASFREMSDTEIAKFNFTVTEMENFPKDYQPSFSPDSFVKVRSYEDMQNILDERYAKSNYPSNDQNKE